MCATPVVIHPGRKPPILTLAEGTLLDSNGLIGFVLRFLISAEIVSAPRRGKRIDAFVDSKQLIGFVLHFYNPLKLPPAHGKAKSTSAFVDSKQLIGFVLHFLRLRSMSSFAQPYSAGIPEFRVFETLRLFG